MAKKPRKIPKIFDGKFFEIEKNIDTDGNVQAKCTSCNETKKGNISSTGNYLKHYEKKHPLKLNELKSHLKGITNENKRSQQPKLDDVQQTMTTEKVYEVAISTHYGYKYENY